MKSYQLYELFTIVEKISKISKLNFFSNEIALSLNEKFVVIDYVNEICDMRIKSYQHDGVPDHIVKNIADHIVGYVNKNKKI